MLTLIISLIALALSAFATFESIRARKAKNDTPIVVESPAPQPVEQHVHVESDFFEVKNGSVHLKDGYKGLYVDGFISAGGKNETMED